MTVQASAALDAVGVAMMAWVDGINDTDLVTLIDTAFAALEAGASG